MLWFMCPRGSMEAAYIESWPVVGDSTLLQRAHNKIQPLSSKSPAKGLTKRTPSTAWPGSKFSVRMTGIWCRRAVAQI